MEQSRAVQTERCLAPGPLHNYAVFTAMLCHNWALLHWQGCPNFWRLWTTLEEEELVGLAHTLNTQTLMKTYKQKKKVLRKFTALCWATFIAILDHGLDTPGKLSFFTAPHIRIPVGIELVSVIIGWQHSMHVFNHKVMLFMSQKNSWIISSYLLFLDLR